MSIGRRTNPTLVGAFVVGAIVLAIATVFFFQSDNFSGGKRQLILFFEGGTSGLTEGAPVVLKGVSIGKVEKVSIGYSAEEESFFVPVLIRVDEDRIYWPKQDEPSGDGELYFQLIKQGLRARLAMQSIVTGRLMVELDFFPDTPLNFRQLGHKYQEIPTIVSGLEELRKTIEGLPVEEIMASALKVIKGLDRVINSPNVGGILRDIRQATADIRNISQRLNQDLPSISGEVASAVTDSRKLLEEMDQQIEAVAKEFIVAAETVTKAAQTIDKKLDPAMKSVIATAKSADGTFVAATQTLKSIETLVGENSPARVEIFTALRDLTAAARSLRVLADYLERHPDALLKGK